MAKLTLSLDDAAVITVASVLPLARKALAERGEEVASELAIISAIDPARRYRCAATFGVFSPQADFLPNVAVVSPVNAYIIAGGTDASVLRAICADAGYKMITRGKTLADGTFREDSKLRGTLALAPSLKSGKLPAFDELLAVPGIADKVASMISALADEYSRVITLDTWMLGGLMTGEVTNAKRQENNYTVKNSKVYHAIASTLLAVADELHVSPFLLQWSLWCYFRGNRHESHLGIFGL